MATAPKQAYQIKISLQDAKPPIWRRVIVVSSTSLPKLHEVIQIAMGWTDSHLHQFRVGETYYGTPDPEFDDLQVLNEKRYKLNQLLTEEKDSLTYEYDFGDGWEHKITLEKILPFDPKATLPHCLTGKRACPPEDVGGLGGYFDFLTALHDPIHPEHDDVKEWVGGDFDPERCDIDAINTLLHKYCR